MSEAAPRSVFRRVLLFFVAFAPLGLYLLCAAIAAALVLGPRMKEVREARLAALSMVYTEIVAATPLNEKEWDALRKALPEGARVIEASADRRRMLFSSTPNASPTNTTWAALGRQIQELGADRIKLEFRPLSLEELPFFEPTSAETVRVFLLQLAMALPVIALLCWGFRRRLDARREFSARQALKWCFLALAGIYAANITLAFLAPPETLSMERYLDTYRPLFLELGPWFAGALMILVAPFVEELIFRKWMLSLLPRAIGPLAAVLLASALFVAVHQPGSTWHASILATPSIAFALVWMRSRSLLLCWLTHAAMNTVGFVAMWALM